MLNDKIRKLAECKVQLNNLTAEYDSQRNDIRNEFVNLAITEYEVDGIQVTLVSEKPVYRFPKDNIYSALKEHGLSQKAITDILNSALVESERSDHIRVILPK